MSEVFYRPGKTFEETIHQTNHVVIAEDLHRSESFRRVIFPEATGKDGIEHVYEETVALYRVTEVLRSPDLESGDVIRVWTLPEYTEQDIKNYHEIGMSTSPIIYTYVPTYPPGHKIMVLLLGEKKVSQTENRTAYHYLGAEGIRIREQLDEVL